MYFFCLVCKKEQAALGYRGQEASLEHMRLGQWILPQPPDDTTKMCTRKMRYRK